MLNAAQDRSPTNVVQVLDKVIVSIFVYITEPHGNINHFEFSMYSVRYVLLSKCG